MRHLACGLLLAASVVGQGLITISHPAGSLPTGPFNALPFLASFASDLCYQLRVPPGSLPARPVMLTEVAFVPASSGTESINQLVVSVGHAAAGALSCNLNANSPDLTVQFQGPHTFSFTALTWSPLGVPLLFPYDGQSGLILEIRILGASGGADFAMADPGTGVERVYNRMPGGFSAATCSNPVSLGLKTALTFIRPVSVPLAAPSPGTILPVVLVAPADPGSVYAGAFSLGLGPVPVGPQDPRILELSLDPLFFLSVFQPGLVPGLVGTLDSLGIGGVLVPLPPGLPSGFSFQFAFVTLDPAFPSAVRSISASQAITLP